MSGRGIQIRYLASTKVQPKLGSDPAEAQDDAVVVKEQGAEDEDVELEGSETHKESDPEPDSGSEMSSSTSSSVTSPLGDDRRHVSCIQEAQLSPDGTCIFTTNYDRAFSVYPIDHNILEEQGTRSLQPYAQFTSPDPIWAFAPNPYFDLNDSSTTTVLVSRRDQYISLHNALWDVSRPYDVEDYASLSGPVDISPKLASYKLIDPLTEEVTAPTSLAYSHDAAFFYAGHQNKISIFDLNYTDEPILKIRTIPSARNTFVGGGRGFKGQISALMLSPPSTASTTGILAAGSRTRYIGLYHHISGQEITHISLVGATFKGQKLDNAAIRDLIGDGITSLNFSPCGTYLYVAERASSAILIYDVRNFSLCLAHCAGRKALTKQKLGFDVWAAQDARHEVWAGGVDGKVRVWRDPCLKEGAAEADDILQVSDGPVVASLVHPWGNLAVVASGAKGVEVEEVGEVRRKVRGGGWKPKFREWGCLDILGLGGY